MGEFATDKYGITLKLQDIKIASGYSSWKTIMNQFGRTKGVVTIVTYSLPSMEEIDEILTRRTEGVTIIANSKFEKKAKLIKEKYPELKIILLPDIHAEQLLIAPEIVWLSSANFGNSGWYEQWVGMHSRIAYKHCLQQLNEFLVGE